MVRIGILLARVQTERNGAIEREGWVLAYEVIGGGVTHLDRAIAHRVDHLQGGNDLASGESLDLEFIIGRFRDLFRNRLRCAVGNVERLWRGFLLLAAALKEVVKHRKDLAAVADLAHRQRRSIGAQTLIQRPKR
jgi:hypothetical protein